MEMVSRRAPRRRPTQAAPRRRGYQSDNTCSSQDDDSFSASDEQSSDASATPATVHTSGGHVVLASDVITPTTFSLALEGLNTGVPTRTTPTLTPTTLRNIEQTFIELQNEAAPPVAHQNQAGFVPPVVNISTLATTNNSSSLQSGGTFVSLDSKGWQGGSTVVNVAGGGSSRSSSVLSASSSIIPPVAVTGRRSMGGRRPAHHDKTPEEEERRRIRRERNKLAAARCRKRRMDHTNCLLVETEEEEVRKKHLQEEIDILQNQKDQLIFVLQSHRTVCSAFGNENDPNTVRIKTEVPDAPPEMDMENDPSMLHGEHHIPVAVAPTQHHHHQSVGNGSSNNNNNRQSNNQQNNNQHQGGQSHGNKALRPTSLNVAQSFSAQLKANSKVLEVAGIPIQTPTSGIFNFDSLMDGGTGLTPVGTGLTPHLITAVSNAQTGGTNIFVPSCSSQQRSSSGVADLSSPDSVPPKLVSL